MIKIYEPLYVSEQTLKEKSFVALQVPNNNPLWRELRFFVDFYRTKKHLLANMSGIFSPKFNLKTNLTGEAFLTFAAQHKDVDVCFVNPFPTLHYYSYNVWMEGEIAHPGITQHAQALLDACGIGCDLKSVPRHDQSNLCYANFWVGSQQFWEDYVGGVLNKIAQFIESNPTNCIVKNILNNTQHTDHATFLPFIIERMFSTYISLNKCLKVAYYPLADLSIELETKFKVEMLNYIVPKVDAADATATFPDDLKALQAVLCRLNKTYDDLYYQHHPHAHSGDVVQKPR